MSNLPADEVREFRRWREVQNARRVAQYRLWHYQLPAFVLGLMAGGLTAGLLTR